MPLFSRRRPVTTTVAPRRRGLFSSRRKARPARHAPVVSVGHHAPVHHQQRRPSIGDKISGALLKLKGTLTGRPGQKAAGTRRMHGTDGRGSVRVARRSRFFR
ncbi:hypothetical protein B0T18DRAFT_388442 [Schizothecium vesticola]|uniref:Uncharacterized protein n=1 Tax=Schizothecium vesticola TaxID=314040 RepID=A0AA40KAY3_9PEZI|nr:hypothetical protein B0T18DRAFT_388442 [Schizothecium vesticola]